MTGEEPGARGGADAPNAGRRTPPLRAASPGELAGLGFQFVASVVLFMLGGRWLDARLGTAPLLLVLGVFIGAGAAFFSMYRRVTAAGRAGPRDRR